MIASPPAHAARARPGEARPRRSGTLFLAAALALGACDVPTEMPVVEQTWLIPTDSTTIGVDRFLPADVSAVGSSFRLSVPATTFSRSLGEICPVCPAGPVTAPKPAFVATLAGSAELPADLMSAALESGTVTVRIANGFAFDPLRPSAGARGRIVTTITSDGGIVAADTVRGETSALAPGATLERVISVIHSARAAGALDVEVVLDSPAGDATTLAASQRVTVTATAGDILVSSARVVVSARDVSPDEVTIDVAEVDEAIEERVQGGALVLRIANPFKASGSFTVRLSAPGFEIARPVSVAPGPEEQEQRLELSAFELQELLGREDVVLRLTGTATGADAGESLVVFPDMALRVAARIELRLRSSRD